MSEQHVSANFNVEGSPTGCGSCMVPSLTARFSHNAVFPPVPMQVQGFEFSWLAGNLCPLSSALSVSNTTRSTVSFRQFQSVSFESKFTCQLLSKQNCRASNGECDFSPIECNCARSLLGCRPSRITEFRKLLFVCFLSW